MQEGFAERRWVWRLVVGAGLDPGSLAIPTASVSASAPWG